MTRDSQLVSDRKKKKQRRKIKIRATKKETNGFELPVK